MVKNELVDEILRVRRPSRVQTGAKLQNRNNLLDHVYICHLTIILKFEFHFSSMLES
jgi:hypothetical protein